jgi:hypothetical protein
MSAAEVVSRHVGPNGAKKALRRGFKSKRPIFLWGAPGLGKSDIIKQLGEELDAPVIDIRLSLWEPTDIKGIPFFNPETHTMEWAPPMELPNAQLASQHTNVILFLDEMNSAAPSVQAAAYQLVLNRKIGTYVLPDNVLIVAAGNRDADKGVTYRMPSPLANRFIHLEMEHKFDDWFEWATVNTIHKDVVGFLTFSKKDLYDFDPKASTKAFATPRSWSFVSDLLFDDDEDVNTLTDLVAGAIGEGLAIKFMAHRRIASKLPDPRDILEGKISKMGTTEISAMYSLTISLCYELKDANDAKSKDWNKYVNNFFKFIMANFEAELVIMGTRLALTQYHLPFDPDDIDCFDEFNDKYGKFIAASQTK